MGRALEVILRLVAVLLFLFSAGLLIGAFAEEEFGMLVGSGVLGALWWAATRLANRLPRRGAAGGEAPTG